MDFTYKELTTRQKYIFSESEQEKIRASKVGVFGVGGNGAPCAEALVRFGVGFLRIVDFDAVELSNIGAQPYYVEDVGKPKVYALREKLGRINPLAEIEAVNDALDSKNVDGYLEGLDVVVDGMDDYRAKVALSRAAREARVPVVHTSGLGYRGSLTVFFPDGITYEEMFDLPSKNKELSLVSEQEFLEHRLKVARIICKGMFSNEIIERMNQPDMFWHGIVVPCHIFGVWAAMEAVKIVIGKFNQAIAAPKIIEINFMSNKIYVGDIKSRD